MENRQQKLANKRDAEAPVLLTKTQKRATGKLEKKVLPRVPFTRTPLTAVPFSYMSWDSQFVTIVRENTIGFAQQKARWYCK